MRRGYGRKLRTLPREVSRTHGEDDSFDAPQRSKACREESAEAIVVPIQACLV